MNDKIFADINQNHLHYHTEKKQKTGRMMYAYIERTKLTLCNESFFRAVCITNKVLSIFNIL